MYGNMAKVISKLTDMTDKSIDMINNFAVVDRLLNLWLQTFRFNVTY